MLGQPPRPAVNVKGEPLQMADEDGGRRGEPQALAHHALAPTPIAVDLIVRIEQFRLREVPQGRGEVLDVPRLDVEGEVHVPISGDARPVAGLARDGRLEQAVEQARELLVVPVEGEARQERPQEFVCVFLLVRPQARRQLVHVPRDAAGVDHALVVGDGAQVEDALPPVRRS